MIFLFLLYLKRSRVKNPAPEGYGAKIWRSMHIFFTVLFIALFGASLYIGDWISSVICSSLMLLLVWTRLSSKRIIRQRFSKLIPIEATEHHPKLSKIQKAFRGDSISTAPKIFIDPDSKSLQVYCFGDHKEINLVTSLILFSEISLDDLQILFKSTGELSREKKFLVRQPLVALFLILGSVGRHIDATLSFILGIKTKQGEPRPLVRKILYFITTLLTWGRNKNSKNALKNYSYLDVSHKNPILSLISATESSL